MNSSLSKLEYISFLHSQSFSAVSANILKYEINADNS
jgi:hypothetical protein